MPIKQKVTLRTAFHAILFTSISIPFSFATANEYKQIAVPPEDVAEQRLNKPEEDGVSSHSTMLPVLGKSFTQPTKIVRSGDKSFTNGQSVWSKSLHVDTSEDFPVIFLSPQADNWDLTLVGPDGVTKHDDRIAGAAALRTQSIAFGNKSYRGKKIEIESPAVGPWRVTLTSKTNQLTSTDIKPTEGFLMFKGDSSYKLYSHLDNKFTVKDSKLNLVAYLVNTKNRANSRKQLANQLPLMGVIETAAVTVTLPDTTSITLAMNDRGIDGDKFAGDGRYTVQLPTYLQGVHTYQIQVEGVRPDGLKYSRTATDLYPIEKQSYQFTDQLARLDSKSSTRASFVIPVKRNQAADEEIFASAEVWGTDANGNKQSAAWIGGVVSPKDVSHDASEIALSFDIRWLDRAQLNAPLELRNMRLQTLDTNTPIAGTQNTAVITDKVFTQKQQQNLIAIKSKTQPIQINQEMLMGLTPQALLPATNQVLDSIQANTAGGKLLLVHGYCSDQVWKANDFSNAAEFRDYNKNRSHNDFALRIRDFGSSYSSFGVVAHSQGGAASVELYAKYWSGLDYASGGRKIQSVGTPYRGTALAGNAAVLGDIFGIGCGSNTDLTYNGASNWLATIPSWARSEVDYYTTSFETKWWRYDYCNLATDLLLDDPEDGTTEKWAGQLSGGVNMGHKKGWCHTNNMRDPAQFKDGNRNSSMNSRAAR